MKIPKQLLEQCGISPIIESKLKEWDEAEHVGIYEGWDEETQEPDDVGVLTITKNDDFIYAGSQTNIGMTHKYKMKIDKNFSFDENLQALIEVLQLNAYSPENIQSELDNL